VAGQVARKLLLKPDLKARVLNAPGGARERLSLPDDSRGGVVDWLLAFVRDSAELEAALPALKGVAKGGLIWVAYRKGGRQAGTDLNRDIIWKRLEPEGLTGVTLVALDGEWSAMRFRRRAEVGN
jgi:hypothetical protein